MTLQDFLEQCVGKWFSQRTSHALPPQEIEAGKADLWVETVDSGDAQVKTACQQAGIDPTGAIALRSRWEGQSGASEAKVTGQNLLVFGTGGKFVQTDANGAAMTGTHALGDDEALTIVTASGDRRVEERIWFASPSLRERTSTVSLTASGDRHASFCSEIRMGGAPKQ
ncbi:MAG: phycobiliprotein lyase [Geitlerinemataceae cyanobacterium]